MLRSSLSASEGLCRTKRQRLELHCNLIILESVCEFKCNLLRSYCSVASETNSSSSLLINIIQKNLIQVHYTKKKIKKQITFPFVPEWDCICKVSGVEVIHFVTLPFEGEDCVGAEPNTSIHPWGEVNAKEGKTRVRDLYLFIVRKRNKNWSMYALLKSTK